MRKKMKSLSAIMMAGILSFSFATSESFASETSDEEAGTYSLEQIEENAMVMNLEGIDASINSDEDVVLEDEKTGETTSLPTEAVDKEGNEVELEYKKEGEDLIVGAVNTELSPEVVENEDGTAVGGWRCVAGTVGSVGGTGLAGAAGGSVVPVVGTAGGAIIGGVSGGLVGAATFC